MIAVTMQTPLLNFQFLLFVRYINLKKIQSQTYLLSIGGGGWVGERLKGNLPQCWSEKHTSEALCVDDCGWNCSLIMYTL